MPHDVDGNETTLEKAVRSYINWVIEEGKKGAIDMYVSEGSVKEIVKMVREEHMDSKEEAKFVKVYRLTKIAKEEVKEGDFFIMSNGRVKSCSQYFVYKALSDPRPCEPPEGNMMVEVEKKVRCQI